MRLIDADYAQEQLNIAEFECGVNFQTDCDHVRNFLNAHPTIDAVHVVRCKDCKHYYRPLNWPEDYTKGECEIDLLDRRVHPDDYCSYGERKEAEGDV